MTIEKKLPEAVALGKVLVTGDAGFLGKNLARELLNRGHRVRVFDLAVCDLEHPDLEKVQGDICDTTWVTKICQGIDTVFHTAAVIDIRSTKVVSQQVKKLSYDINLGGTQNIIESCFTQGVKRLVYTSSNSVVINGQPITNGDEDLPYVDEFRDLYTETKAKAEQRVLAANGQNGLHTCAIRPSGIWGPGDQTMFKLLIKELINGSFKALVGDGKARLDNAYVHNLIHGKLLAAAQLSKNGNASGQAYFINDGEPVNMMEFSRPLVEQLGHPYPKKRVPYQLIKTVISTWEKLHQWFKIGEPPQSTLALERIGIDNFFSIDKAHRDLGYEPLYTSEKGMKEAMPYYQKLHDKMKEETVQ
ncbi:NAD-dependent epimerase/dehydratase family protein [Endozoicomonas sp. SCSIO W0465]|uniref:NAD-dependent epimerase/dehydratase family protein n=1 Tax=Endozoicomonas sp. SCSIO W0465 TaxID=2918516 RepID=UPI0020764445|nr:NAD-dependent epimerase/dehydratase family protein [Endozoicomonas sp. SCSIO W0465]USE34278.1 NAD-dependent epimerase/dehydratase family protein [Endozoicomonas sp. SCSIO W0465]